MTGIRLFKVSFSERLADRVATCGGMDSELTGTYSMHPRVIWVMAHSQLAAAALLMEQRGGIFRGPNPQATEPVFDDVTPWENGLYIVDSRYVR